VLSAVVAATAERRRRAAAIENARAMQNSAPEAADLPPARARGMLAVREGPPP
jgi:hypothetical protein